MNDLTHHYLTEDKLRVGFYFWLLATIGFVALSAGCGFLTVRTGWAYIPMLGLGLFAFNSLRFTHEMGKNYLFIRRAIKKGWYRVVENTDRVVEIANDMEVRFKIVSYRKNQYAVYDNIVCFSRDRDFVKFNLMF